MKIQNNTTFQGTKLKHQKLDHIVRNVNNEYPRISPYKIRMLYGNKPLSQNFFSWLGRIENIVDDNRNKVHSQDYTRIIENDLYNVKTSKLGDCGESSAITIASLIANGIKNFKVGLLLFDVEIRKKGKKEIIAQRAYNTTHEMIVLNTDEMSLSSKTKSNEIVVMDTWLGFCGNLQKAIDKFYEVFMHGTRNYTDSNDFEHQYHPRIELFDLKIDTTKDLSEAFAKKYPELVIKSDK